MAGAAPPAAPPAAPKPAAPAKPAAPPKPAAPAKPAEPKEGEKPAEEEAIPPAEEVDEYTVPSSKPKPPAAAPPAKPAEGEIPAKAPELREAYGKAKAKIAELEKAIAESRSKPVDDTERKTFTEQITTLTKRLEETEGVLKFKAFEQSNEYKEKYENPFVEAYNEGRQQAAALSVVDGEGEPRKGTPADFEAVMRASDDNEAGALAHDLFGSNAPMILWHRMEVKRLNKQRVKAIQDFNATLGERTKKEQEEQLKSQSQSEARRAQNTVLFEKLNKEAAEKHPEIFASVEGDEEGNALLEKGIAYVDAMFRSGAEMTDEQRVKLHSAVRNRAAAYPRLLHRLNAKDAQIAALTKELEEIRGSEPGGGQERRDSNGAKVLSAEEEIDRIAAGNR
jgi:hypothetical protein